MTALPSISQDSDGDADERSAGRPVVDFRAVYERELSYVWANLRRLGIPSRDLPDVTHDVFLVVYRNFFKYDAARPFRPWLFGVLARVASDHLRLSRNRFELLTEVAEPFDVRPTPEAEAELHQRWRVLDRALDALPPHHRVVLVMHDIAGHSAREVSSTLGIPFKTVYSRLHAARLRVMTRAQSSLVAVNGRDGVEPGRPPRRKKAEAETDDP